MSNGACKFSPFLKMSSTAGNEWSNCQHCVKRVQTIETQFRQYHVTKVVGSSYRRAHDHISGGGLEPLGPIGVYAYGYGMVPDHWTCAQQTVISETDDVFATSGSFWRCDDKECVARTRVCDDVYDCKDRSDERHCREYITPSAPPDPVLLPGGS